MTFDLNWKKGNKDNILVGSCSRSGESVYRIVMCVDSVQLYMMYKRNEHRLMATVNIYDHSDNSVVLDMLKDYAEKHYNM